MANAFPIGERCGFNLTACEEVLLLDAYRLAEPGIDFSTPFMARFRDEFVEGERGVEERCMMVINDALAVARLPAIHRFYPRPSAVDEYMRTRGDQKIELRQAIRRKLEDAEERKRVVNAARVAYNQLLPVYGSRVERDAFEASVARISMGNYLKPAKVVAPPEPEPVRDYRGATIAAPRVSSVMTLERRVAPPIVPGALAVQNLAHELALARQAKREMDDRISDAEAAVSAACRTLEALQREAGEVASREGEVAAKLQSAIADL